MVESASPATLAGDPIGRLDAAAEVATTACGDGRIVWRSWGSGEPLLLIHGGFGSWLHWIRNIEALSRRYSVVAVDLPGLGDSSEAPQPHSAEAIARLLYDGLAQVIPGHGAMVMAGFSLGAAIAAPLAALLRDRVRHLVLCSPSGIGSLWQTVEGLQRRRADMPDAELQALAHETLARTMISDPRRIDALALRIQRTLLGRKRYLNGTAISQSDVALATLERLHCDTRVVVVWGERDAYLRFGAGQSGEHVRGRFPDVDVHIVQGAGHWVHYEADDEVNELLAALTEASGNTPARHSDMRPITQQHRQDAADAVAQSEVRVSFMHGRAP